MQHTHFVSVAGLVTNETGEVLLIKSPNRGWEYPGGMVEVGESLEIALYREIQEETGWFVKETVILDGGNVKIIAYEDRYRDDLIFMILEAKNALGRVPGLNNDLLDIKKNYMENGDMFWLAVDENDRVIGSVGYRSIDGTDEVWLHRLFVKYNHKHEGIGTQLLRTAEAYIKQIGKKTIKIHLGTPREQWFESYAFYPKYGYWEYEKQYMKKELETQIREG